MLMKTTTTTTTTSATTQASRKLCKEKVVCRGSLALYLCLLARSCTLSLASGCVLLFLGSESVRIFVLFFFFGVVIMFL